MCPRIGGSRIAQVVAAHIRNLKCVLHEIDIHAPPQALTTRSPVLREPESGEEI